MVITFKIWGWGGLYNRKKTSVPVSIVIFIKPLEKEISVGMRVIFLKPVVKIKILFMSKVNVYLLCRDNSRIYC